MRDQSREDINKRVEVARATGALTTIARMSDESRKEIAALQAELDRERARADRATERADNAEEIARMLADRADRTEEAEARTRVVIAEMAAAKAKARKIEKQLDYSVLSTICLALLSGTSLVYLHFSPLTIESSAVLIYNTLAYTTTAAISASITIKDTHLYAHDEAVAGCFLFSSISTLIGAFGILFGFNGVLTMGDAEGFALMFSAVAVGAMSSFNAIFSADRGVGAAASNIAIYATTALATTAIVAKATDLNHAVITSMATVLGAAASCVYTYYTRPASEVGAAEAARAA